MSQVLVASRFVWSHYPGLRAGLIYSGKGDITRHPDDETHVVADDAATETLCGLPRSTFAHEFPETRTLGKRARMCATCRPAGDA